MLWPLLLLPGCLALVNREPPLPANVARNDHIVSDYVNVRLNHFDASDTDTFPMRYYYNDEFARNNYVIIFVGGEWEISEGWVRTGQAYELAEIVGGGLFYTEHRYYGQTRPSNNTNVSDLRFLTVDQALADLVQFIQYVKSDQFQDGKFRDAKVALVGCSYAGSMATWMKLAYPHIVDGSFSDSGPLHAQEEFPEYLEVIADALRVYGGESCLSSVEEAMKQLVELLATSTGPAQVSQMFNTCSPLQAATPLDLSTFFWFGITETFAYLVQYAVGNDIPEACAVLTDSSVASPVQRLANWIVSQPWTQPCIETRYSEVVAAHTNTSFDAPDSVMRLWTYQTCVEFGWYQTTKSDNQPFLTAVPLEYFHQMCRDFFSTYFDTNVLRTGIARTNAFFAGLTHIPDGVISVAGGHDPWSPMGPNESHGRPSAPVYVVPGASHCRAIYEPSPNDSAELSAAKKATIQFLYERLTGHPMLVAGAPSLFASSLVFLAVIAALL